MGCGASRSPAAPQETTTRPTSARLIDGKSIASSTIADVRRGVDQLLASGVSAPSLVVVLVGSNPASMSYIKRKMQAAEECGACA